ncbi:MAG: HEAT repeat domain-containing protein [Gemmataceae bacterium]
MKIRAWLVLGCGILLVGSTARGQDLEKLKKQLEDPDPKIRLQAAVGLGKHGKAAVPLVRTMLAKNRRNPNAAAERNLAMQAIMQIGPEAADEEIMGDLLTILHQFPKERAVAAQALGKIGKPAAEGLSNFAKNRQLEADIRRNALDGLGVMGPEAAQFLDGIVPNLEDADRNIRASAVNTISKIGAPAKDAIGNLSRVANADSDAAVRIQATVAMCAVAPTAEETVKVINGLLQNAEAAKPVIDSVARMGGDGVPLLLQALKSPDQNIRFNTLQSMIKAPTVDGRVLPGLVPLLNDPVLGVKNAAVQVIGKVGAGPGAAEAAPALGKLLDNKELRPQILPALERMGKGAAPAANDIGKLLLENDVAQTARVLQMLLKMEDGAGGAIDSLLLFNQSAQPPQQAVVSKIMAGLGKGAAPALIAAMKSENVMVRQSAASMIGDLGAPAIAAGAGPVLKDGLTDPDAMVRQNCLLAFEKVGVGMVTALKLTLGNAEVKPDAKALIIRSVGDLGPQGKPAVDFISGLLKDKSPLVRLAAAGALKNIGVAALDAVPKIAENLTDPDPAVRTAAAETLKAFGIEAKAAVPLLVKMLQSANKDERRVASETLVNLEFASVPPVGELLATHPNMVVRAEAMRILHKLAAKSAEAAPNLIIALSDPNDEVRTLADDTLKQVPPDELVVHLGNARKSNQKEVRTKALELLVELGPKAKGSAGAILEYVNDKDPTISGAAVKYFVDNRAPNMNFLIGRVKSLDKENKLAAAKVLTHIGPTAAPALAALKEAQKDNDKEVATAVGQAIAAITRKK